MSYLDYFMVVCKTNTYEELGFNCDTEKYKIEGNIKKIYIEYKNLSKLYQKNKDKNIIPFNWFIDIYSLYYDLAGDTGNTEPKEQQPGNSQAKGPQN